MNDNDILGAAGGYVAGNAMAKNLSRSLQAQLDELDRKKQSLSKELDWWEENFPPKEKISETVAKYILSDKKDEALGYLNGKLLGEMVEAAKAQDKFEIPLAEKISRSLDKYGPFYEKIGSPVPENLRSVTAEGLCDLLGVELLTDERRKEKISEAAKAIEEKKAEQPSGGTGGCAIAACIVLVIALVVCAVVF